MTLKCGCSHKDSYVIQHIEGHDIFRCPDCDIVYTAVEKTANSTEIERKYSTFYENKKGKATRFFAPMEWLVTFFRFLRAFWIYLIFKPKSVLDIGCGRGYTLYFLKRYFKIDRVTGTQVSYPAFKCATEKIGPNVHLNDLLDIDFQDVKQYDVITLWHVLEHLENPDGYLDKIRELLSDNGTLFFQIPNLSSWTRRMTGKYWLSWDIPYHLYHFNLKGIERLLARHEFKVTHYFTFSLEYATYTSAQSIASLITKNRNALYNFLRGKGKLSRTVILQGIIVSLIAIPCFLINFLLYLSRYGEVTTIYAKKI